MNLVSLTDCCRWLAIDPKTLHHWMSLSHLSAQPSPLDARCKCLTREQVQQLALLHRRMLVPDGTPPFQPRTSLLSAPTRVKSEPVLPEHSVFISGLLQQLGSLQAQVVILQHQLTLLANQYPTSQLYPTPDSPIVSGLPLDSSQDKPLDSSLDKSLDSPEDKSLDSSLDKSLDSPQEKKSRRAKAVPPLVDHSRRPCVLPLVEYATGGKYVVITPEQGLLDFEPDSPEWFAWLSTLTSFRFVGASGHLTVHRHKRSWSWRATRSIRYRTHSLSLVRTEDLTSAVLEQAAASLQSLLN